MNKLLQVSSVILILIIAFCLRFYNLNSIPAGLHADGASQGYNAFSLLNTSLDRYGQSLPILFRAFGYYQPPLYTYLTIIPVAFFGNSPYSARFISALSGLILIIVTYLLVLILLNKKRGRFLLAGISALTVAIAPWAIFFSRLTVEANLGLLLLVSSLLLFVYSLQKIRFLPIAGFVLGISTHAYYSERLISVIFLPLFILIFKSYFLKFKKWVVFALLLFFITQIPHLVILKSGAFAQRFNQVSSFNHTSGIYPQITGISKIILNNYLIYYSPKNLFFDSDSSLGRTMPGLSVFYNWLLIPFLTGIWWLLKNKSHQFAKVILLLIVLTPLPAAFTDDFFYPLRTLDFLWTLSIVIAVGLLQLYNLIKFNPLKIFLSGSFLLYSLFSLYISYFILFKYEKAESYGYAYIKLMDKLSKYSDKQIVIDSARDSGIGVRLAYLNNYPPREIQNELSPQIKTPYYSGVINTDEVYSINNLTIKPLSFADACQENMIMVGDILSISPKQAEEHKLKLEFEVYDLSGKIALFGYSTHPKSTCPIKSKL